jgi:hypothetical protein
MKKIKIITLCIISFIVQSCASLNSETIIEPNKTFVLGEGKHASYSAIVKNIGNVNLEIFKQELGREKISAGILKINQENSFDIAKNTAVFFQNYSSSKTVRLKIKLVGTSNLSMGYQ